MSGERLVIVGGSAAGARAAHVALNGESDVRVDVISRDPHAPYYRPGLSKQLLKGAWSPERAAQPVPDGDGLTWHRGVSATEIDLDRQRVVLDDGRSLPYDRLLLAPGCRPRTLPGVTVAGRVCEANAIGDIERIRSFVGAGGRAVVVGAGLIGSEVASSLLECEVEVTLVDPSPTPLARALGTLGDEICVARHRTTPMTLLLGVAVEAVTQNEKEAVVELTGGQTLTADVVVVCAGVVPDTEWIGASGLPLLPDGGIDCDEHLLVRGVPGVAAAGDAASWTSRRAGRKVRVEHWLTAVEQGAAAVRNLLSLSEEWVPFDTVPMFWTEQHGTLVHFLGFRDASSTWEIIEGSADGGGLVAACRTAGATTGYLLVDAARRLAHYRRELSDQHAVQGV